MEKKLNESKTLFAAIVGRPNVGKSSLLNNLLGQKVAIVTYKPQTTRTKIVGVVTKDNLQIVFTDTPGLHKAKNKLSNHMLNSINESVLNVDISLLVVDSSCNIKKSELLLIESFKKSKSKVILVMNKIDLLDKKEDLMPRIDQYSKLYDFEAIVPVSVKKDQGLSILSKELSNLAIPSIHFFPDDTLTDQPEKVIVSEIIREKILVNIQEEIPHSIAVIVESMKKRKDKELFDISCIIYCEKESHKGIIIGKDGSMLKKISTYARTDIESFLDCRVNLECWVKVKSDWRNKEHFIKMFGLN